MSQNLIRRLFEPSSTITGYDNFRSAKLTIVLAFTLAILLPLNAVGVACCTDASTSIIQLITVASLIGIVLYLLSRTKHVAYSSISMILLLIGLITAAFVADPDRTSLFLVWLLIPLATASVLLSLRQTVVIWILNLLIVTVLIYFYADSLDSTWDYFAFYRLYISVGALLIAATYARVEDAKLIKIQQGQLKRANESLEQALLGQSERLQVTNSQLAHEQQSRRVTEIALQRKQRLEGIGLLAGGIAHDFNNLLTGIMNQIGLAEMKLSDPENPAYRHIEKAYSQVKRTALVTRQLLSYAGRSDVFNETINLPELVNGLSDLLERVIDRDVKLIRKIDPEINLMVEGDWGQLQQVVMNLIVNAADAIEGAGVVTVSLDRVALGDGGNDKFSAESSITGEPIPSGNYQNLTVSDTGCGMTAETISKIFQPFFTTKETGHGLGLSAILGILRTHNAALFVESEVDVGTTFRVLFPACVSELEAVDPVEVGDSFSKGLRFLVIDDDPAVRESTEDLLTTLGHDVAIAENGQLGVEKIEASPRGYDVILLDLNMPIMRGESAFYAIRNHSPETPIIINSGNGKTTATDLLLGEPSVASLPKPYTTEQLQHVLHHILAPD